jgi:hypothetical protein
LSVLLGSGERLFQGIDVPSLGYELTKHISISNATHVVPNEGQQAPDKG